MHLKKDINFTRSIQKFIDLMSIQKSTFSNSPGKGVGLWVGGGGRLVGLNLEGCASAFVAGLFTAFLSWATVAFVSVDLVPLLEIAGDSFLFDTSMFLLLLLLIGSFSNGLKHKIYIASKDHFYKVGVEISNNKKKFQNYCLIFPPAQLKM